MNINNELFLIQLIWIVIINEKMVRNIEDGSMMMIRRDRPRQRSHWRRRSKTPPLFLATDHALQSPWAEPNHPRLLPLPAEPYLLLLSINPRET